MKKLFRISHAACCRIIALLLLAVGMSQGFLVHPRPNTAIVTASSRTIRSPSALNLNNPDFLCDGFSPSPILSHGISELPTTVASSSSSMLLLSDGSNEFMDIARNIAWVIFLFSVVNIAADMLIPAATKLLEKEVKDLEPGLWEEYEARLNEGETMGQRLDLLQELTKEIQRVNTKPKSENKP